MSAPTTFKVLAKTEVNGEKRMLEMYFKTSLVPGNAPILVSAEGDFPIFSVEVFRIWPETTIPVKQEEEDFKTPCKNCTRSPSPPPVRREKKRFRLTKRVLHYESESEASTEYTFD